MEEKNLEWNRTVLVRRQWKKKKKISKAEQVTKDPFTVGKSPHPLWLFLSSGGLFLSLLLIFLSFALYLCSHFLSVCGWMCTQVLLLFNYLVCLEAEPVPNLSTHSKGEKGENGSKLKCIPTVSFLLPKRDNLCLPSFDFIFSSVLIFTSNTFSLCCFPTVLFSLFISHFLHFSLPLLSFLSNPVCNCVLEKTWKQQTHSLFVY